MSELAKRITSSEDRDRTKATYEVTQDTISSQPDIVGAMRQNLTSSNDDLLEITVMRLGSRAFDVESLDKIIEISKTASNSLVRSATIFAMSAIAMRYPEKRGEVVRNLEAMKDDADDEIMSIIKDELLQLDKR